MDNQIFDLVLAWVQTAMADTTAIAIGIFLFTEFMSSWNKIESKVVAALCTPVFSLLCWFGGGWGKHSWWEAFLLTWFAWFLSTMLYQGWGRIFSGSTIKPAGVAVAGLVTNIMNGKNGGTVTPPA